MRNKAKIILIITTVLHNLKCTNGEMYGFVVGGDRTQIDAYPHAAFLEALCSKKWICGSSILNQRILITAAHCLYRCNLRIGHRMNVLAGSSNIKSVNVYRKILRFVTHEKYNEKTLENDIALALLDRSLTFGKFVKRVIIKKFFPSDVRGDVAGWGSVNDQTGAMPLHLKHVRQKLRSWKTCALIGELSAGMFCAGSSDIYEDHPAHGDSGSALVIKSHTAIGLVSFNIVVYPALVVYTNVSYFYPWVTSNAQKLYCNKKTNHTKS